jgi:hypothetical protein
MLNCLFDVEHSFSKLSQCFNGISVAFIYRYSELFVTMAYCDPHFS